MLGPFSPAVSATFFPRPSRPALISLLLLRDPRPPRPERARADSSFPSGADTPLRTCVLDRQSDLSRADETLVARSVAQCRVLGVELHTQRAYVHATSSASTYDPEIHRVHPAGAQPLALRPQARHAAARPGRGALRLDRAGNADSRRLGGASRERPSVPREAAALLLAHRADVLALRPLGVGDPSLVGDCRARHGAPHMAHRTASFTARRPA